jgi:26S proteasome regulatory subunit T5
MEVDEKPSEDYNDIGGLDKQIEELVEAIVLPMTHSERFKNLGIKPPKGKFIKIIINNSFFFRRLY